MTIAIITVVFIVSLLFLISNGVDAYFEQYNLLEGTWMQ